MKIRDKILRGARKMGLDPPKSKASAAQVRALAMKYAVTVRYVRMILANPDVGKIGRPASSEPCQRVPVMLFTRQVEKLKTRVPNRSALLRELIDDFLGEW